MSAHASSLAVWQSLLNHNKPQEAASLSAQAWIALIHKSPASCYGVSFPDLPGIITAADTLDEALERAGEVLAFAFEDWQPPAPRGLEELRVDAEFVEWSECAVVAEVRPSRRRLRPLPGRVFDKR
jgi:antitoxin HicB